MSAAFKPKGEVARWRLVYDRLCEANVDDIVTYQQLSEVLDLHPTRDRHTIQMAMRRAAQEYETENRRALVPMRNQGYRVVGAEEHLALARTHQKKAGHELARGYSKVVNVDMNGLEPAVQQAFGMMAQAFALQMDFNRRFNVRQTKLEKAIRETQESSTRTDEEVAELRARLERLEQMDKAGEL